MSKGKNIEIHDYEYDVAEAEDFHAIISSVDVSERAFDKYREQALKHSVDSENEDAMDEVLDELRDFEQQVHDFGANLGIPRELLYRHCEVISDYNFHPYGMYFFDRENDVFLMVNPLAKEELRNPYLRSGAHWVCRAAEVYSPDWYSAQLILGLHRAFLVPNDEKPMKVLTLENWSQRTIGKSGCPAN